MNPNLRDRILRKLETLSDERGYQALDYVEFLESRYAEKPATGGNLFRQFAEGVEDKLRAGRVSASTIAETMSLMNKAVGMLEGVAAAGKSVANDLVTAAKSATAPVPGAPGAPGATAPTGTAPTGTTPTGAAPGAAGTTSATGTGGGTSGAAGAPPVAGPSAPSSTTGEQPS